MRGNVEHLLVFARLPEPGKTKTRLIDAFGASRACELYCALAKRTIALAGRFAAARGCRLTICFCGGEANDMKRTFGNDLDYRLQEGGELGSRLIHSTDGAFHRGAGRVIVVGTDCHELTSAILSQAFDALSGYDFVLGPALDGGYYLIGLNHPQPELFNNIDWGTSNVFEQTKRIVARLGKRCLDLEPLADVDFPDDVLSMRNERAGFADDLFAMERNRLSVIIPALNEERQLAQTLCAVGEPGPQLEIIVVDGGSVDSTFKIALDFGCRAFVIGGSDSTNLNDSASHGLGANRQGGRAKQMNAGAAVSSGESLLFLHADTRLPPGYIDAMRACLAQGFIAGAFRLGIDEPRLGLRVVAWGANLRSQWRQIPYGDQAIFMNARTFFNLGGYRRLPIMEDLELVLRLRRRGRIGILSEQVSTSGRRWRRHGIIKTTAINQLCLLAYRLGISSQRIAQFYRGGQRHGA